jgi:hypothetical protein
MLSEPEYRALRAQIDTFMEAVKPLYPKKGGCLCLTPEMRASLPPDATNEQKSAVELYEFIQDPPERYFAYVRPIFRSANKTGTSPRLTYTGQKCEITTWTGDILGRGKLGTAYQSNMGDIRVPIAFKAINGRTYYGTFFFEIGDYCRVKAYKEGKK